MNPFQRFLSVNSNDNNHEVHSISSSVRLNSVMKQLIDAKKYKAALDVFESKYQLSTDYSINMAIKASTITKDYNRLLNIKKKISSSSLRNSYIQTSLIQFYCKLLVLSKGIRIITYRINLIHIR